MQRHSRKSFNARKSSVLPRQSDVYNDSVNPEQIAILQDLSVAVRPSLMPSPERSCLIPEDSNVASTEFRKRFPDDKEWYNRLDKTSRPSLTPRVQTKNLRRLVDENESVSSGSEVDRSVQPPAHRKLFAKKKKPLFTESRVFDEALDDTALSEPISWKSTSLQRTSWGSMSNIPDTRRRSSRLLRRASDVTEPDSPTHSPRESFRRWKHAASRRKSSSLAEAIQGIRVSNAGITINESGESTAALSQRGSSEDAGPEKLQGGGKDREIQKALSRDAPDEGDKDSSSILTASLSPPQRRTKLFGKATKRQSSICAAFDAILDETSEASVSSHPASQSSRTSLLSKSSTLSDKQDSLQEDARRRLFPKKATEKGASSVYDSILDNAEQSDLREESNRTALEPLPAIGGENPANSDEESQVAAEESPTVPIRRKPFAKTILDKQSCFADELEVEDNSSVETALVSEILPHDKHPKNPSYVSSEAQSRAPKQQPDHLSVEVNSSQPSKDDHESRSVREGEETQHSHVEKQGRIEVESKSRKSRGSSANVSELDYEESLNAKSSTECQCRSEQEVSFPESPHSISNVRAKQWVNPKSTSPNKFDEILLMHASSFMSTSPTIVAENEGKESAGSKSGVHDEAVPVAEKTGHTGFVASRVPLESPGMNENTLRNHVDKQVEVEAKSRSRKSRRSSPLNHEESLGAQASLGEDSCVEQVVPSPELRNSVSRVRTKRWAIVKCTSPNKFDEILALDASSVLNTSSTFEVGNEEVPDRSKSEVHREAAPVSEEGADSDFVLPKIPPKRKSLREQMSELKTPRVVIVPVHAGIYTSTPTLNVSTLALPSPLSSIKDSTEGASQDPIVEKLPEPSYEQLQHRRQPSSSMTRARETPDQSSEEEEGYRQSQNKRQSSRLMMRAPKTSDQSSETEEENRQYQKKKQSLHSMTRAPGTSDQSSERKAEDRQTQSRRRSSRLKTRAPGTSDQPPETEEEDGQSQKKRQSSRSMTSAPGTSDQSSETEREDRQLQNKRHSSHAPGTPEKSSQKKKEDRKSQKKRQSSRSMTRAPGTSDQSSETEKVDRQSQNRRHSSRLMAHAPGTSDKSFERNTEDRQSQNKRQSSRSMTRAPGTPDHSSETVEEDRQLQNRRQSSPSMTHARGTPDKSSEKKKEDRQSQKKRQSSRSMTRAPATFDNSSETVEEDRQSLNRRQSSPSMTHARGTHDKSHEKKKEDRQSKKKRQSSRSMTRAPGTSDQFSETVEEDRQLQDRRQSSPSMTHARGTPDKSSEKKKEDRQSQNKRQSSRSLTRAPGTFDHSSETVEEDRQSLNRRQSSPAMTHARGTPDKSSEKKKENPQSEKRKRSSRLMTRAPRTFDQHSETEAEGRQSQNRRQSSRSMTRAPGTSDQSSETEGEDRQSRKRKRSSRLMTRAAETSVQSSETEAEGRRSQNRRQFSRSMTRAPGTSDQSSETEEEDRQPQKRKQSSRLMTRAPGTSDQSSETEEEGRQSQNKRQSSRSMTRGLGTSDQYFETEPEGRQSQKSRRSSRAIREIEDKDVPSTADRVLLSPKSKFSRHRKSKDDLQTKRLSLRQMVRSPVNSDSSSEREKDDDNNVLSSADTVLLPPKSKSSPNRKSTRSEHDLRTKGQSLRQMVRSSVNSDSSSEREKDDCNDVLSSADTVVLPPKSKSSPNRKSTRSEHDLQSKGQSLRQMVRSPVTADPSLGKSRKTASPRQRLSSSIAVIGDFADLAINQSGDPELELKENVPPLHASSPAAKRKRTDDYHTRKKTRLTETATSETVALDSLPTDNINLLPIESLIGMSSKTGSQRQSHETKDAASRKESRSRFIPTPKSAELIVSQNEDIADQATFDRPLQLKRDDEEATPRNPRLKSNNPESAAPSLGELGEQALPPPPKKSVIPERVRSDIRKYFVKSTPLKEAVSGDDTLVPLDATKLTPIKKFHKFSVGNDLELEEDSMTSSRVVRDGENGVKSGEKAGSSNPRIQALLKWLDEPPPKTKVVEAQPSQPARTVKRAAISPKNRARQTFQLKLPDGTTYKQPKLVKPKKFVTDKMYRFITRNIKDNTELDTRVRAENFVTRLCDTYNKVLKRKNTKHLVEELLEDMVRLGLVSTYSEFYSFVEKFMPKSFRTKAIPCITDDLAPKPKKGINEKLEYD